MTKCPGIPRASFARIGRLAAALATLLLHAAPTLAAKSLEPEDLTVYDVIVYGGSSAGVIAATQAAQMGKSTLLIVPGQHFGGMTASGLGETDVGVAETIGGQALSFYSYIYRYYHPTPAPDPQADATGQSANVQFTFEPKVAEAVFLEMLHGANASWVFGEQLDRSAGVVHVGDRIASLQMESGRSFAGRMFIDATYEGDLLAASGVSHRIGRESQAEFGETLAGVCRNLDLTGEVDPFRLEKNHLSGLLPGVSPTSVGPDGSGDNQVQQYNFRLCLTSVPANRIAITPPWSYDPADYEMLRRLLAQHPDWTLDDVCKLQEMPGGKIDVNATGSFSTDMAGDQSSRWSEASYVEREVMQVTYKNYTQGLFWFLANDPGVSPVIRAQAAVWGLPKDEFADTNHWPWQLYVREARRMRGAYVVTQADCEGHVVVSDPIALASYALDSHKVTLFADENGLLNTEGLFFESVDPYPISYRAITPLAKECGNLLVPVCLSATHVAFNSIRMEPVFMMLGQSAATAACLALDEGTTVQGLNYDRLARQLKADGQILTWHPADVPVAPIAATPAPPPTKNMPTTR